MPCHWGHKDLNVVTQSSATGSQCLPAVGSAEAARYIGRRDLPGCVAHGDELTYVSLGEGACSQGEFWESLNTACVEHLPVLYVVADNGYAISVPASEQSPAPVGEMVSGFRGLAVHRFDGRDYFEARSRGAEAIAHVRAGVGPALIHADGHPARIRTRRPTRRASTARRRSWPTRRRTTRSCCSRRRCVDGGVLSPERAQALRDEAFQTVADAAKEALAAPRPDPGHGRPVHVKDLPTLTERAYDPETEGGEVVAFGEAIKLTLHEVMAADERIRVFGEDVGDAREDVIARRRRQRRRVRHHVRSATRVRPRPLLQHAAGRGQHRRPRGRPSDSWSAARARSPVLRLHLDGDATDQDRGGDGAVAVERRVQRADGVAGPDRRLPHRRRDLALAVRRVDLRPRARAHRRVPVAARATRRACCAPRSHADDPILFLEHKHLLRQPYTRDPFPPADYVVPFGKGTIDRAGDDLTVVTYGATVEKARRAADTVADDASVEIIDLRWILPWDHELVAASVAQDRPRARRARGRHHVRLRRRGRGVDRRALLRVRSTRRCDGWRPSTPMSRTNRLETRGTATGRRHRRRAETILEY